MIGLIRAGMMLAAFGIGSTAEAQDMRFDGPYAGPLAGALEHRFTLETSDRAGRIERLSYSDTDIAAGAVAGYDLPIARRIMLGAEASVLIGGGSPGVFVNRGRYQQDARFGLRTVGRVGVTIGERMLLFAKAGYGADRFAVENTGGVDDANSWRGGLVLGGGAQFGLDQRIALRLEYENLSRSSQAFLVGLPIRF